MGVERKVLIYGAGGYTGKLTAESLGKRNIPFYAAGRNKASMQAEFKIVEERLGRAVDVEFIEVANTVESLAAAFENVDVVINTVGPFMQLGGPVVEACLKTKTHYLDTTGEQDWILHLKQNYHQAFSDAGLLLSPANAYMWCAGAIAAEYVLENPAIDSLDILYQIDNALPSEASTKSFLRMVCQTGSQDYLKNNEMVTWKNDVAFTVTAPNRSVTMLAHPWGGGGEPIWFMDDDRVRNCTVLSAFGDEVVLQVVDAISLFNTQAKDLTPEEQENWTNSVGDQMAPGEPDKDDLDMGRTVIVVRGQGRQETTIFTFNLSAPYQFTGEISAEAAIRLLAGDFKRTGFASAPQAFGHRELMRTFADLGFSTPIPA